MRAVPWDIALFVPCSPTTHPASTSTNVQSLSDTHLAPTCLNRGNILKKKPDKLAITNERVILGP